MRFRRLKDRTSGDCSKRASLWSHRVEVVEEAHAVWRRRGLHGELQEGLNVQVRLDHRRGPQESWNRCSGPVYSSCTRKQTELH